MTRRSAEEVAREWLGRGPAGGPSQLAISSLARLLEEYARGEREAALAKVDEVLKEKCADERDMADISHQMNKYEAEDMYEYAGNAIWRAVEAVRALASPKPKMRGDSDDE